MSYTEEEIKKYLNILYNYNKPMQQFSTKSKCKGCPNTTSFTIDSGYKICDECGVSNGAVLGFYDVKDCDRLYYRKKSIYHRKYHYEKKVRDGSLFMGMTGSGKNRTGFENFSCRGDGHCVFFLEQRDRPLKKININ